MPIASKTTKIIYLGLTYYEFSRVVTSEGWPERLVTENWICNDILKWNNNYAH